MQRRFERIRKVVSIGAKIPAGQQIKEIRALEGHFTRATLQYVVYVDFGAGPILVSLATGARWSWTLIFR